MELLKIPAYGTQWNTALYDDSCLIVVPGSHKRPRTKEERDAVLSGDHRGFIPGYGNVTLNNNPNGSRQINVKLEAGQTVFYNNNIVHRAEYGTSPQRATLHGSMGTVVGGSLRAKNILQHRLEWIKEMECSGRLNEMRDRLVSLAEQHDVDKMGYSLEG